MLILVKSVPQLQKFGEALRPGSQFYLQITPCVPLPHQMAPPQTDVADI